MVCILAPPVKAFEWSGFVSGYSAYTDNARIVDGGEEDEYIFAGTLGISASHQQEELSALMDYEVDYFQYTEDVFNDETMIDGKGIVRWNVVPESASFYVKNKERQTTEFSRIADTPDNKVQRSIVEGGGDFSVRMSPVDQLFSNVSREILKTDKKIPNNNDRDSASFGWQHILSDRLRFSLHYQDGVIDFDNEEFEDYDYSSYGLTVNKLIKRGKIDIVVGRAIMDPELSSSSRGNFYQVEIKKEYNGKRFSLLASKMLTDSSIGISHDLSEIVDFSGLSENVGDLERINQKVYIVTMEIPITKMFSYSMYLLYNDESSLESNDEDKQKLVNASIKMHVNDTDTFKLSAGYVENEFLDEIESGENDKTTVRLHYNKETSKKINIYCTFENLKRTESDGSKPVENEYRVGFSYLLH